MLNSILGLLLALGILVTIHEYGHFWVARRFGVKVLRFSIGFGQPIWRRVDKYGTEFVVAWIPLGGYVKMLDEREGDVPQELLDQAFTQKSPAQKIAIAMAGPVANFLFAIIAFALMHMIGVRDLVPVIDAPISDSPTYVTDLSRGDKVVSVDGNEVQSFSDLGLALAARVGDSGVIEMAVDRQGSITRVSIPITNWLFDDQSPNPLRSLGITPKMPELPAIVGRLEENGVAQKAGFEVNDLISAVNSEPMDDWMAWVEFVRAHPGEELLVEIDRNGNVLELSVTPGEIEGDNGPIGYVGVGVKPVPWEEDQLMTSRLPPWTAIWQGTLDTGRMVGLSYNMLGKMVSGKVSLRQIGGPISMAQMAGMSVESGFEAFFRFLALISISLAIVNLLPIPVLDGGHVVMHSIEWIKGGPMSERSQVIGMQLGMMFIVGLMLLAFFNDISRLM